MLRNRLDRDRARADARQWLQVELLDENRVTLLRALLGVAIRQRSGGEDGASPAYFVAR